MLEQKHKVYVFTKVHLPLQRTLEIWLDFTHFVISLEQNHLVLGAFFLM